MSIMSLTPRDCATLWNQVPLNLRNEPVETKPPTTSVELLDRLRNLDCQHVREAALALGDRTGTQDWKTSINRVKDLCSHKCTIKHYPLPTETKSRLFKVSDVPVFENIEDYERFRSSLLVFFQSEDAPLPHQYELALRCVLLSFKHPGALGASRGWNVTLFISDDWTSTYTVFIAFLDSRFQSVTIEEDIREEYMGTENDEAFDSYDRFQAYHERTTEIRRRPKYKGPTVGVF